MALARFLEELARTGRVRVAGPEPLPRGDLDPGREVVEVVRRLDRVRRAVAPGRPPDLVEEATVWAGRTLHRACQLLCHRDVGAVTVRDDLGRTCPVGPSPGVCHSVDLVLRHLPGLARLARARAPADPLVEALGDLGRDWPLSSVGMKGPENVSVDAFWPAPSLRLLYVDRILETGATDRLDDPRVGEACRAALGGHPDLAPAVARALANAEDDQEVAA